MPQPLHRKMAESVWTYAIVGVFLFCVCCIYAIGLHIHKIGRGFIPNYVIILMMLSVATLMSYLWWSKSIVLSILTLFLTLAAFGTGSADVIGVITMETTMIAGTIPRLGVMVAFSLLSVFSSILILARLNSYFRSGLHGLSPKTCLADTVYSSTCLSLEDLSINNDASKTDLPLSGPFYAKSDIISERLSAV